MAYNTGNPLGSSSPEDLSDNSHNLDLAMGSTEKFFLDRFGRPRLTYQAFHEMAVEAISEVSETVDAAQGQVNDARDNGISSINATRDAASAEMLQTAAELGADLNTKHYKTYDEMVAAGNEDPPPRDAVLAFVDADDNPLLNGFYSWSAQAHTWSRSEKQLVFKTQVDARIDPLAAQLERTQASPVPVDIISDKSSGSVVEVLTPSADSAQVRQAGPAGEVIDIVDTRRRRLVDFYERIVGPRLSFGKGGISSRIQSFFYWDIFGDLSFRGKQGIELSVSQEGVRLGAAETVDSPKYSVWRHLSGRLMSRVDRGVYIGDPSYLGATYVPPNRAPTVPRVVLAQDAPERQARLVQGCPSIAWVEGRIWVSYFGGVEHAGESMSDFQIFRYSDDNGLTWVEWAYWVQDKTVARLNTSYLWLDPTGILWAFVGTDHSFAGTDAQLGCWAFSIKDPLADKPTVSRMWRASNVGYPGFLNRVDERVVIPLQVKENLTAEAERKGVHLYEFDPTCRAMTRVGVLPITGDPDWQESNVVQLRDGSLMAVFRTLTGLKASYCESGDLNTWTTPVALSGMLGANPNSRACLRRTPKGNLILAFNSGTTRVDLTLVLLNDAGTSVIQTKRLHAGESSYPDITFDSAGNILVVWDFSRLTERQIRIGVISEADFVANGAAATQRTIIVDDK